jgi:hypothetical protein
VPLEKSSGNRRRLGHITKQGSSMLRFLLVEAAQVTVRSVPEWRSHYFRLMMRRGRKTAKVAMARRLAIRLYWMWRQGLDYEELVKVRFARGTARKSTSNLLLFGGGPYISPILCILGIRTVERYGRTCPKNHPHAPAEISPLHPRGNTVAVRMS